MALLSLHDVSFSWSGRVLLDAVTFHLQSGNRACLTGRNGTGKSTLLQLVDGRVAPDAGRVVVEGGLHTAYLPQTVPDDLHGTAEEVCLESLESGWERQVETERVMRRLKLEPAMRVETLSGGMKRRVLLARVLGSRPDVLLLDEPTNHLDLETIEWLETYLRSYHGAILFVTHDRMFLQSIATRILDLDRGRLMDWACDYRTFVRRKEQALQEEVVHRKREDRKWTREEAWLRQGIKARRGRDQGRVRALMALRKKRAQRRDRCGQATMQIQSAGRSGELVLDCRAAEFSYDDLPLIRRVDATIMRGDKVGITGPNGCGKTTLLRLLLGGSEGLVPTRGEIRQGTNLAVAYFDQLRAGLKEQASVIENVTDGTYRLMVDGRERNVYGYLEQFLFEPAQAEQPVCALSGGERNRLLLAKLLAQPANVLVLDEPTNDLDLETLELLEDLLVAYTGTLLLVTHDREFLNRCATSILAFERRSGDARFPEAAATGWYVNEYVGGYDDWLRQRCRPAPPPAAAPADMPPRSSSSDSTSARLGYMEQRELERLPEHIALLEQEVADLHRRTADPEVYRSGDRDGILALQQTLQERETELEHALERWAILAERAEVAGKNFFKQKA